MNAPHPMATLRDGRCVAPGTRKSSHSRTAAAHSTMPTSTRYQLPGSVMPPPMNASGIDPSANGQNNCQEKNPARANRTAAIEATSRFRTSAVGRIIGVGIPRKAIAAR